MTDLLIRNVDDAAVAAIDAQAERMGISRAELLGARLRTSRDASVSR